MTILAIQYLESNPGTSTNVQLEVEKRLRTVLEMMPISLVLIGWDVSESLFHICRREVDRYGAKLFRWHPLLTGKGGVIPRPEWRVVGLGGENVPGFRGMPDFTFMCPNRQVVQAATLSHLSGVLRTGLFDGIFLDRIRFPSPAADPSQLLSCFCKECRRAASDIGLDLAAVKSAFRKMLSSPDQTQKILELLIDPTSDNSVDHNSSIIDQFLRFRVTSITNMVTMAAKLVHDEELEVGLDTFSPTLTRLVGQDITALDSCCEWIKVMTYGRTFGPAGLPFEILALSNWLKRVSGLGEMEILRLLSRVLRHPMPASMDVFREYGVEEGVLQIETERGRSAGVSRLLVGMELVDLVGVTNLNARQIGTDLRAFHEAGADGLVFSWDLWLMPLERLKLVARELKKIW